MTRSKSTKYSINALIRFGKSVQLARDLNNGNTILPDGFIEMDAYNDFRQIEVCDDNVISIEQPFLGI